MWCVAQRVSARSSATLRRPLALISTTHDAPVRALHARTLSSVNRPPQAEQTPSVSRQVDANDARAHRCLGDLLYALRFARTPKQLTTMWSILLRRDPVVVAKKLFLRPVGSRLQPKDADSARVTIPDDSLAVRMVSASELRELIEQGKRDTVVESFPSRSKKSREDTSVCSSEPRGVFVSSDRVLLVSEKCIARTILGTLFYTDHYLAFTQFLEEYEAENRLSLASDPTPPADVELAALGDDMNPWYMEALGHLKEHARLIEQYERRGGADLLPHLIRRKAIRALLDACMAERDAHLARTIVDQTLDRSMLYTFTFRSFTLTLQACLHGKKTVERLQHAMHIYRRMRHEAGFVLRPEEWSLMVHAAVFLGQHEQALEVFGAYRAHGIAPFQRRFQQAIFTACQQAQYDTVIAMVRECIEQEHEQKPAPASTKKQNAKNISNTLWYMLKGSPSRDHVEQVLLLMQSQRFEAGSQVLRRVVANHFVTATDDDHLDADAVVSQFFDLWERVPDTILRNRFVLQLVLEECESRDWEDQMERVLEYANENEIELPIVISSIKEHGSW